MNHPSLDQELIFESDKGHALEFFIDDARWLESKPETQPLNLDLIAQAGLLAIEQPLNVTPDEPFLEPTTEPLDQALRPRHITFKFSSDSDVRQLNHTFRGRDAPTNVLSFPASPEESETGMTYLGDAILAYETVKSEAIQDNKPQMAHISHLVIHAVLHLLGYDHEDEIMARAMEKLESELMNKLGYDDPYAE